MNNMGGGGSKPAQQSGPRIIERPNPSLGMFRSFSDGLEVSKSQNCSENCGIVITPSVSVSSMDITRTYGFVSREKCSSYTKFVKEVDEGRMTFEDFKRKLENGELYRFGGGRPWIIWDESQTNVCGQLKIKDGETFKSIDELKSMPESKLSVRRIQQIVDGKDFSSETKVTIIPSIPPSISVNGNQVVVNRMTLYHPCPLRIEGIQYDAVLSLNDPSDKAAKTIVLVPVKVTPKAGQDALFLGRIAAYVPRVSDENPVTGEVSKATVPTGNNWNLTSIIPIKENGEIKSGFYMWTAADTYEKYVQSDTRAQTPREILARGTGDIVYDWRPVKGPDYVMIRNPISMSPADFASLQSIPATPPSEAIHPVPTEPRVIYKSGLLPEEDCSKKSATSTVASLFGKESFTLDENTQESCDPFTAFANAPQKGPTISDLLSWLGAFVLLIALAAGVYVGLQLTKKPSLGNMVQMWGVRTRNWVLEASNRVYQR